MHGARAIFSVLRDGMWKTAALFSSASVAMAAEPKKPNIILVLVDNLGWGQLGSYRGGLLRRAPTPRPDKVATDGFRVTNFNVERECVPIRAALDSLAPAGAGSGATVGREGIAAARRRARMSSALPGGSRLAAA
jgi:hypothetical protein